MPGYVRHYSGDSSDMIEIGEIPGRFSFSSLEKWMRCEKQWELSYLHTMGRRSGWASVGGSAVHLATERYDIWRHSVS